MMDGIDYRLAAIPVPGREEILASPFCFRADLPESGDDPLVMSVSRHGIINPPIMLSGSSENDIIVTGHRRLA
ncbi:MAG TPA: hypothetical protein VLA34_03250, partial [Candidatus Krumholzibacterium sp.]|nr:hypothetical protein [Candidatus Krumholzibacterium sp.]